VVDVMERIKSSTRIQGSRCRRCFKGDWCSPPEEHDGERFYTFEGMA
jgi:hypothetical protein